MNFKWMPELEQPYGYPIVMSVMIGLCGYLFYRFRRAGWL
jgi:magnesium transporter